MLEARRVVKEYALGRVTLQVLKGVSLQMAEGEFVSIAGPSGAGKSTLLHLLAGLDTPTRGDILWEGEPVSRMSDAQRARFRNRRLGIVFQFYHLLPELTALENVALPGFVGGRRDRKALQERAADCLEHVGLDSRMRHKPSELSGGEQQRVAIARALVNEPQWLLCDEPTGNLDSKTGSGVVELLVALHRRQRMGLVVVTHHASLAELADRMVVLQDGAIVAKEHASRKEGVR